MNRSSPGAFSSSSSRQTPKQPEKEFDMNAVIRKVALTIVGLFLLAMLISAFYTVESGYRAIVFTNGKISDVVADGLHIKIPFFQSVIKVDVKTMGGSAPAIAGSKDMQTVHTTVAVNYHLDSDKLAELYSTIGLDVDSKIIAPRIQEAVKAVVAKYSADQLLAQRETVKKEIAMSLTQMVTAYYITLEDIQITNFEFSDQYNKAIEDKQAAEQAALTAKNNLERIKIEAEQKVSMAQAEAEAIRIQANAIRAQGGSEYVQLKAIEKWNGTLPATMAGGSVPFVNLK